MRLGPISFRLAALVAAALTTGGLFAQPLAGPTYPSPSGYSHGGASAPGPMHALFTTPIGGQRSQYVDAHGQPIVVPAGYYGHGPSGPYQCDPYCGDSCAGCGGAPYCGCADPYACDPYGGGYGCPDAYACDGGYGYGPGGHGRAGHFTADDGYGTMPPFVDGLENFSLLPPGRTEQCGPHYFDVRMEAVHMTRDEAFRDQVDFTSLNVDGPIVLSSNQLDFKWETGFRILGRYDVGPLCVLEFGYWGLENLDASASFTDPDPVDPDTGNLYSLFTDFVRMPADLPADVTMPDGALPWTERSITQSISLESELHTAEMNVRRYWVGFNPAVSGTLLAGFRFTRMREDFLFATSGEAQGAYLESIKNDMAGFQAGGDMWIHVRQGLRVGVEGKVGLVNNHYTLDNTFTASPPPGLNDPSFTEHFEKDQPALIVDASADVVCDICPSWSIRAGYEILFLNSVLLAGENFNTGTVYNRVDPAFQSPDVLLPARVPFVNDQGDAFYHGGHLGLEFVW